MLSFSRVHLCTKTLGHDVRLSLLLNIPQFTAAAEKMVAWYERRD